MKAKSTIKEIKTLTDQIFGLASKNESNEFPKLSSTQLLIMDYILEHSDEVILQKDLENALKLTRATLSSVLGTLEKYNIIKRLTYKNDTRIKQIVLTEKAIDFYKYGSKKMQVLEELVTKDITEEELTTFFNVIDKIKINMERMKQC